MRVRVCVPDYVREVASQIGSNMHRPLLQDCVREVAR